ncbi:MAG: hypothetical protein JNK82_26585 [Myxococcaceae bacterium]|nr:hypothetical protein [Myxococcaceae bacterium]
MTNPSDIRTQFAQRAITIAEAFGGVVGAVPVEGPIVYRVEMVVPEELSTGGGAKSVQHLRLVPVAGGAAIVIGQCDQIEMSAVLRGWEVLAEQYAQRFRGAKLPVDAVEYGKLLDRMDAFFRERLMRVDRHDLDRAPSSIRPAAKPAAPKSGAPSLSWAVALVLLGAAIGSAVTLLLR